MRIVGGDIHHLGIRGGDDDFLLRRLRDGDLRAGFQVSGLLGLCAQILHCLEEILRLRQVCVTQPLRPVKLAAQRVQCIREGHERLDAVIPGLVPERILQGVTLEAGVAFLPTRGLRNLQGIGGRHQHL